MAQKIPMQEQIPPQMDLEPEMGAAAAGAAVCDTPPPHLRQIPSPTPSKTATDNGGSVPLSPLLTQMVEMITQAMRGEMQRMGNKMNGNARQMTNDLKENARQMKDEMKTMRGEMRQVGQCLQAGRMALPRAGTSELRGSATAVRPAVEAGEDRVIRETCWARRVEVTETVTQREKLNGVTETCTSETRREVTELTETREIEKIEGRLHGTDGVEEDAHTHTEVVEDNGGELAERVETRCGQRDSLLRERRETLCPLEADHDQVGSVVPRRVEGMSAVDGRTQSLGGMATPGALVVARVPGVIVPSASVPVCVWCRRVCTRAWQNACCDALIAGV